VLEDAAAASGAPHSPQNFWSGEFEAPQDAHVAANAAPHSPQNLFVSGLSAPQFEQLIKHGTS
jgi:hypothetical protein